MARVTVEDCVKKLPNRFELVSMAAQRARDISSGSDITVDRDNDKNPVVALREIAEETIVLEDLKESLINSLQTRIEVDDLEEEELDSLGLREDEPHILADENVTVAVIGENSDVLMREKTDGDSDRLKQ